MKVEENNVISIHYTLKDDGGQTIDSSIGEEPLVYIHGMGHLIPGLENALMGKVKGDKINVSVEPKDGYGDRNDDMKQSVPKTEFEDSASIQVGMQFEVKTPSGPVIFTVEEIKENEIILDGNHPLAGKTLHFDVEINDIREATKEEIEHKHVHGPGGHHH